MYTSKHSQKRSSTLHLVQNLKSYKCYVQGTLGTRSGGACWHDKLFDILQQMLFKPPKADSDIWMISSKDGTHYKYIAVYVDDLVI